jgi:hypothetical protein
VRPTISPSLIPSPTARDPDSPNFYTTNHSALLVACIRGGETNCHRSDAVRLLKELAALGIKPNAITYGQYMRAIAEGQ